MNTIGRKGVKTHFLRSLHLHKNHIVCKAKKKILFVSCNGLEKNGAGRSVKKFFLHYLFGQKCVLCMFYIDWELGGWKKLKGRNFFE